MSHRVLQSHVRRRYRAGARIALLASLLVGTAFSGVFGTKPRVEISQHREPPAAPAVETAPAVPDPEIEPASLPLPTELEPAAYREVLIIDGPVEFERPPSTPSVERLVL